MRVIPLVYCSFLSEEEIVSHEYSDRIWVPQHMFERWMMVEDVGSLVLVELNGIPACMYGPHSDGNMRIYAPSWICEELGVSMDPPDEDEENEDDFIEVQRIHPDMCTFLKLQPHTSDHLYAGDPEETLSRAFEQYTCIVPGQTLTLLLPNGISMEITIIESNPTEGPLCIRNAEIVLDLLQPLDSPPESSTHIEPATQQLDSPPESSTHIEPTTQPTPSREERRALYAQAALARIKSNEINNGA